MELSESRSVIKINLNRRTRNHLNVMYFGALAMGAELSIAIRAVQCIQESKQKIDFIFKDFKINFIKRSDSDVHFVCDEAHLVKELIEKAKLSKDRLEAKFQGYAYCPENGIDQIATYELTLSVKNRSLK